MWDMVSGIIAIGGEAPDNSWVGADPPVVLVTDESKDGEAYNL